MSLSVAEEVELLMLLEEEAKYQAKTNYYEYVKYVHPTYEYTRHGEFICRILDEAVKRRKKMLAGEIPMQTQYFKFSMPPQHGKSLHITETFPSFFLGNFPNEGVIEVSYNDNFASRFGSKNKDKIQEYGEELFGIRISKDTNAKGEWEIIDAKTGRKTRGGMISRGIASGITGSSFGDCIIIDDPIKNREEANSEAYREKLWNEWKDSISTRIHPGAIVILIMTRWHEDDIWGRLANPEYGQPLPWKEYNLPLECDITHMEMEGNPLNRKLGEPLWPERYGKDFIEERKQYQDSFHALYQGRPTNEEGEMFKKHWWRYWKPKGVDLPPVTVRMGEQFLRIEAEDLPDRFDEQLQSWDCAFKDSDGSDFVCGQVWARRYANKYLLDQVKDRMDIVRTMDEIMQLSARYPKARLKLIEDKANGPAVIQMLKRRLSGLVAVNPEGGKVARASAVAPEVEGGNVYLPHPAIAPWVNEYIQTFAAFPKVANDDEVDATSQALNRLMYNTSVYEEYEDDFGFEVAFGNTGY